MQHLETQNFNRKEAIASAVTWFYSTNEAFLFEMENNGTFLVYMQLICKPEKLKK